MCHTSCGKKLVYGIWGFGGIQNNTGVKENTIEKIKNISFGAIQNDTGAKANQQYRLDFSCFGAIQNNTGAKART